MIKVFSFGGGVQSTAALVLAAQDKIDYRTFLFCNVGEDSESLKTLAYVHDVAVPYAAEHGVNLLELRKMRKDEIETVYSRLTRPGSRSIGIPVRMRTDGQPGRRQCTADFKIRVVDKWLKFLFNAQKQGAMVGLGISVDEIHRAKPNMDKNTMKWKENAFPLLELGLNRRDCLKIIEDAGLLIPPKSACIFCPFHTPRRWQEMREEEPEDFWKSVELERFINQRRAILGKDPVYLTRFGKPLDQVTTGEFTQSYLFDDEMCESGYCMV